MSPALEGAITEAHLADEEVEAQSGRHTAQGAGRWPHVGPMRPLPAPSLLVTGWWEGRH